MALSNTELFFSITKLLGGLGLFVYGMTLMSSELQKSAGVKLRALLYRLTKNRVSGFSIGTLLGFLIHSGATTVMTVSFINAGLMTLVQSIGVTIGANVGTTLSMQIISFNIARFSFLAIFIGLIVGLVINRPSIKHLGYVLLAFGLIILGMDVMAESVVPLKNSGYFEVLLRHTDASTAWGMISGLLISVIFTAAVQSSGATIGILFALSTAGVFKTFDQVFPLILGAHIGTCSTALLGSIGTHIIAKRSALSHLLFNVLGAILAMVMYRAYAWLVPIVSGDSLLRQIANAHTLVQTINGLLLLPFVSAYAAFIVKITPSKRKEPEKSYLDDKLLETPEKAIMASILELRRMSSIAREMFQTTMRGFLDLDVEKFHYVRKSEEVLDALKGALSTYMISLAERNLSRRQSIIIQYLIMATNDLERIGDHVETIAELTREKIRKHIWFEEGNVLELIELYKKADNILGLLVKSFEPAFYDAPSKLAMQILEVRNEYVTLSQKIKQSQNDRILEKKENPLNGIFFHRFILCFDKLVKHSKTIALVEKEPFFFVKKHKLEKKTGKLEIDDKSEHTMVAYDTKIFEE